MMSVAIMTTTLGGGEPPPSFKKRAFIMHTYEKIKVIAGMVVLFLAIFGIASMHTVPTDGSGPAPIEELFRRDAHLYEPNWILAADKHRLWISDAVHRQHTLYRYDLEADMVDFSVGVGRGPGELSEMGMKWMSTLSSGDKLVFDSGSFRMHRYRRDLSKPTPVRLGSRDGRWLNAHLVADTMLIVSPMSPGSVLQFMRYDPATSQTGAIVREIEHDDRPEWIGLKNFLLKNGHVATHGDALYYSFLFAPYIMKVNATGLQWVAGRELETGFPVNLKNPNEIRMPDASEHAQQTISIAADARRVYVLHNGEKAGFFKSIWATFTNDFSDLDDQLNASSRLRLYSAITGQFLEEWTLPVRARLVTVHPPHLYLTTQIDGQSTLIAYRMTR